MFSTLIRSSDLADRVVFTDVEIQDGWQDDLEASANWRSTVSVLEEGAGTAGAASGSSGGDSGADTGNGSETGLGAFGTDEAKASAEAVAAESGGGSAAAASAEQATGETVEFTGTVVQTGSPVILDDGQQTKSVETDSNLRLGERSRCAAPSGTARSMPRRSSEATLSDRGRGVSRRG